MAKISLKRPVSASNELRKQTVRKHVQTAHDVVQVLKKHRKLLNISQAELARLVNLNRQSVSNIERFDVDPQLSNMMEMLRICGIKVVLEFTSEEVKDDGAKD